MDEVLENFYAQLALMNWVVIIAIVGFCEVIGKKVKRHGKADHLWLAPIILGAIFGAGEFFKTWRGDDLLAYWFTLFETSFNYSGWSGIVYVFIRPVKYFGDKMKGAP